MMRLYTVGSQFSGSMGFLKTVPFVIIRIIIISEYMSSGHVVC